MKFKAGVPVTEMSGTSKNSQLSYTTVGGSIYGRAKVKPLDARTPEQLRMRAIVGEASRKWPHLTEEQRRAWEFYAKLWLGQDTPQTAPGLNGFIIANGNRGALGLPLIVEAPTEEPPSALERIEQVPGQPSDAVRLRLTHNHADTSGLVALARMTPATRTPARKPQPRDLRSICGIGPSSAMPLPPSGGEVTFGPTRFPVNAGQRYALELRIVRVSDGVPSATLLRDFKKT
jgi:hypothetical protein